MIRFETYTQLSRCTWARMHSRIHSTHAFYVRMPLRIATHCSGIFNNLHGCIGWATTSRFFSLFKFRVLCFPLSLSFCSAVFFAIVGIVWICRMRSTLQLDIVEMRVRNQREKQNHHHDCLFRLLACLADARCSIARSVTVSMSSHENKQAKCLPDALRRHNTTNANATGKYIRPFFFFIVRLHQKRCCTGRPAAHTNTHFTERT